MKSIFKFFFFLIIIYPLSKVYAQEKFSLEDCLSYAKKHNYRVNQQRKRIETTESDIKIAKGNYLPNLSFTASQNFSLGNSFDVSTNVGQRESSSNSFSLSSSLTVFNAFSNKYKSEKAWLSLKKANTSVEEILFDLYINVTNKYLQILLSKEILKVAKEQVVISKNHYDRLLKLYKNDLSNKREMLEIESTLASDEKEVIIIMNRISNNLIELQELIGYEQKKEFDIEDVILEEVKLTDIKNVSEEIIKTNPQIKLLNYNIKIQEKDLQLLKTNFYPKVNLSYSYSSRYFHILGEEDRVFNSDTNMFEPNGFWVQLNNNRTHFIGLSAIVPIFNGFSFTENHKKSKKRLEIQKLELEEGKQRLRNKIKVAKNDLASSKATLKSSKIAFKKQELAFEIIQKQYEKGNINSYLFLEGKNKLLRSNSGYVKARYDLMFKNKVLAFYLNR